MKKNCDGVSFERYKLTKESKKAVQNARTKVYKEVYEKLNAKEVEKDIYRIARITERKTHVLWGVSKRWGSEGLVRDENKSKKDGERVFWQIVQW